MRLIFQPAEELANGAEKMVSEGALDNVDEVYSYHSGTFGCNIRLLPEGPMTTSIKDFEIIVKGKGCHGAYPEKGKDPITAICQTHIAMHTILSRGINRKDLAICTIGSIHAGTAENVIPDTASMKGTLRTNRKEVEDELISQLKTIVENIPKGFGCTGELVFHKASSQAVVNTKEQGEALVAAAISVMGKELVTYGGANASEDFSWMLQKTKGAYMICNWTRNPEKPVSDVH